MQKGGVPASDVTAEVLLPPLIMRLEQAADLASRADALQNFEAVARFCSEAALLAETGALLHRGARRG